MTDIEKPKIATKGVMFPKDEVHIVRRAAINLGFNAYPSLDVTPGPASQQKQRVTIPDITEGDINELVSQMSLERKRLKFSAI